MKVLIKSALSSVLVLLTVSSTLASVLHPKAEYADSVSVENLVPGNYYIQSVSNSSLLIGAFKNGYVDSNFNTQLVNVTTQMHDTTGNQTVENALIWYCSISPLENSTGVLVLQIYRSEKADDDFHVGTYTRMELRPTSYLYWWDAWWKLFDAGNDTTLIRRAEWTGVEHVDCLSENGENNDIGFVPCNSSDVKQLWHFIPAGNVTRL